MKLRVLVSATYDPWFNLATEDWIFREMDPSVQTLFLWRNQSTVVIGRNQNPWSECNLEKMEADGVTLARRTSGGGAVFQDLGNSCFTFLSPRENYDRNANSRIILNALRDFGIEGEASGRNDLVIEGEEGPRKFSGSAFRETRDRCFHHGTLLLHADLGRLAQYLTPHPKKLESKGRTSVRARVVNLRELAPSIDDKVVSQAIIGKFFEAYGARCEVELLDRAWLESIPSLLDTYRNYASWDWRFGNAPQFTHQMVEYLTWGFIEVFLDSERGHVSRAQVFSDALFPELILDLQEALHGKPYSKKGMSETVGEVLSRHPARSAELTELENWLHSQVEV